MELIKELLADPNAIGRLFQTVLQITLLVKLLSWAYFRGAFGQAGTLALTEKEMGFDEFLSWLLGALAAIASLVTYLWPASVYVIGTSGAIAALIAIGLLLIVLWGAVLMLAYHDLPRWLANLILGMMIVITLAFALFFFLAGAADPFPGDEFVIGLIALYYGAFIAAIIGLFITLLYKLARAAKRWLSKTWVGTLWRKITGDPQTTTGGGTSAIGTGVTNPSGAVGAGDAIIPPESCITVDFGTSSIEDHWGVADLRLILSPANAAVTVEVSNDGTTWESCTNEGGQDYDVPWWNSPWRYVRICNRGNTPVTLSDVQDLSN